MLHTRTLEVYPRGRNAQNTEQVSFVVRNVTSEHQRATCQLFVRSRQSITSSHHSSRCPFSYLLIAESPPAFVFQPSGSDGEGSDQWVCDSTLSFSRVSSVRSPLLSRGTLHLALKIIVCEQPVAEMHSSPLPSVTQRRYNIADVLRHLQSTAAEHTLPRDLARHLLLGEPVEEACGTARRESLGRKR